jgi:hypothetical protein
MREYDVKLVHQRTSILLEFTRARPAVREIQLNACANPRHFPTYEAPSMTRCEVLAVLSKYRKYRTAQRVGQTLSIVSGSHYVGLEILRFSCLEGR